tara:strand:- start:2025 stop:4343 length:2319 start_codon:yes stop_codon:yes gene_type:complete
MAFQVSPGVSTAEIDLTTRVPIPSLSQGAMCITSKWGPIAEIVTVSSEDQLVENFGKPNGDNFQNWLNGANFLNYANTLRVVRTANTSSAKNAVANGTAILIKNDAEYQNTAAFSGTGTSGRTWFAKHAGELGNSLKTSICVATRANTQVQDNIVSLAPNTDIALTGTFTVGSDGTVTATSASAGRVDRELEIGDVLLNQTTNEFAIVTAVTNSSSFTATQNDASSMTSGSTISITRLKRSAFEETIRNMMGVIDGTAGGTTISGTNTRFQLQLHVGDIITLDDGTGNIRRKITAIASDTSATVDDPFVLAFSNKTFSREWEFRSDFEKEPLTSDYAYKTSGSKEVNDEVHIVLVDEGGDWTATKDVRGSNRLLSKSVLETYPAMSVANGAISSTGESIYYKDYVNDHSSYIRWGDHAGEGDAVTRAAHGGDNTICLNWGNTLGSSNTSSNNSFRGTFGALTQANGIVTESFSGGVNGSNISDADMIIGWKEMTDPNRVDISFVLSGETSNTLATFLIQEVAEARKDCVAFISPESSDVVNQTGSEVTNTVERRNGLPSSSYGVMDGNYKYMLDRFNGVYRYVPLNGDIAGICASADNINPYISPAGFNRGNVKNVTKLAYDPTRSNRDDLYVNGINPIVSFPGQGTVLFGDKTLLAKPSAFDRINVRRLFIILEKAIANAAQFSLFEFNDDFSRAQFVSQIEPFLRDVQSRRGILDFKVVCDATNNPPAVVDRNEFRGDIFIKPSRSINFISLNFVAVASGVEFSEVVNAI